MNHIEVKDLYFGYTDEYVLKGLNFEANEGEIISIIGENGSGKSTLLKLILGELKPNKGTITLLGKNAKNIQSYKEIGYVPQVQNFDKVAFPITCLELVVLNQYEDFGFFKIPNKKMKQRAMEVFEKMDLKEYINTPFNELSGGLQQRVIISRAIINNPKLLILDEPTAGVDKDSKAEFLALIKKINLEQKVTIIIVTHEMELINELVEPDKIFKIEEGVITNA